MRFASATLKVFPPKIRTQLRSACGQEGGLAPAGRGALDRKYCYVKDNVRPNFETRFFADGRRQRGLALLTGNAFS